MSNETEAIKVLERFNRNAKRLGFNRNVSHVLVFTTFDTNGQDVGFGDEGKWRWMARIAASRQYPFVNETDYGEYDQQGRWTWSPKGINSILYKLMTYGKETKLGSPPSVVLEHFELVYFSKGAPVQGQVYALVCVYEVKYG